MVDPFSDTPSCSSETSDRARIITAAQLIYARGGINLLQRTTVARLAGVTPDTVSRHFRSRSLLMDRLTRED